MISNGLFHKLEFCNYILLVFVVTLYITQFVNEDFVIRLLRPNSTICLTLSTIKAFAIQGL